MPLSRFKRIQEQFEEAQGQLECFWGGGGEGRGQDLGGFASQIGVNA